MRFGPVEFSLMTGLSFRALPQRNPPQGPIFKFLRKVLKKKDTDATLLVNECETDPNTARPTDDHDGDKVTFVES